MNKETLHYNKTLSDVIKVYKSICVRVDTVITTMYRKVGYTLCEYLDDDDVLPS